MVRGACGQGFGTERVCRAEPASRIDLSIELYNDYASKRETIVRTMPRCKFASAGENHPPDFFDSKPLYGNGA